MKRMLLMIGLAISVNACEEPFDFDDYETRVEYFKNINTQEYLQDSTITVVTWNIKLAFGHAKNPWSLAIGGTSEMIDDLVAQLNALDPDIVLLQEVPYDRENTEIKRVLDTIGVRMGYNYAFGGHGFNSNGSYPTRAQWGNAILSKYPIDHIENLEVFNLNDVWSRRSIIRANLKVKPNEYWDCYSLHYTTDAPNTEMFIDQVHQTVDWLETSSKPQILGGDFNYSRSIDTFFTLVNCMPEGTDDIDRIYYDDTHFEKIDYYRVEESIDYSDHFAGLVTLKLK